MLREIKERLKARFRKKPLLYYDKIKREWVLTSLLLCSK